MGLESTVTIWHAPQYGYGLRRAWATLSECEIWPGHHETQLIWRAWREDASQHRYMLGERPNDTFASSADVEAWLESLTPLDNGV